MIEIKDKKIGIIGCTGHGKATLSEVIAKSLDLPNVIIVGAGNPHHHEFIINSVWYEKIPDRKIHGGFDKTLINNIVDGYFRNEFTDSDDSYIIDQFRLIKAKQCCLSKSKRDKIESEFNKRFRSISAN